MRLAAYEPVELQFIEQETTNIPEPSDWKLNLFQVSRQFPNTYYVAIRDQIVVFQDDNQWIIKQNNSHDINAILVAQIGTIEFLGSVDSGGSVYLYQTKNIQSKPLLVDNFGEDTWGLAINQHGLLAVSDNSHRIKIWNIATVSENLMGNVSFRILSGHRHNIPAIEFTHAGDKLVSCSIGIL